MRIVRTNNDFITSVEKAFKEIDKNWEKYAGLVVVGSHKPQKVAEKIGALKAARESGIPTLGICLGMQLMAVEYAVNVLDRPDATSEEFGRGAYVVKKLPELRVGIKEVDGRHESHWHNFAFNNAWKESFVKSGWNITSAQDSIAEIMRLRELPFYVGTQFHPEYQSSKQDPHPLLKEFITSCKKYSTA